MISLGSGVILHLFHHYNEKNQPCSACGCYVNEEGKGLGANIKDIDFVNCKKCLKTIEEDQKNAVHSKG